MENFQEMVMLHYDHYCMAKIKLKKKTEFY